MTDSLRVYSLGYEGISLERYVQVLKANDVALVVDVRETPWSYKPGFSKKPLAECLSEHGIFYVHLKSAGNPSRNRKMGLAQNAVIDLYKEHLDENPGCLDEIYELIAKSPGPVCLLCFEEKPHDCHRKVILDRIAEQNRNLIACHLNGSVPVSEQSVTAKRIPQPDDRKRTRVHVKVAENESSLVTV
jgi:uncharacterized protein (DUF488 family)